MYAGVGVPSRYDKLEARVRERVACQGRDQADGGSIKAIHSLLDYTSNGTSFDSQQQQQDSTSAVDLPKPYQITHLAALKGPGPPSALLLPPPPPPLEPVAVAASRIASCGACSTSALGLALVHRRRPLPGAPVDAAAAAAAVLAAAMEPTGTRGLLPAAPPAAAEPNMLLAVRAPSAVAKSRW